MPWHVWTEVMRHAPCEEERNRWGETLRKAFVDIEGDAAQT